MNSRPAGQICLPPAAFASYVRPMVRSPAVPDVARLLAVLALLLFGLPHVGRSAEPKLRFRAVSATSAEFDTGIVRGTVRLDGKSQGIASLVHLATGMELAAKPGLLSYYRVFSSGKRYGDAARDWPVTCRILEDGALQFEFSPSENYPFQLASVFRWMSPDSLDVETTVKAKTALPGFEVFLSSYLPHGYDGLVYSKPNRYTKAGKPGFLRADWSELIDGNYLVFPRQLSDLLLIYDGRWEIPPNPVTWTFARYFEAPAGIRRHSATGLSVAFLSRPTDCFAIAMPYNKQPPDGVAGHSSLYLCLFGRDLAQGETAVARCRMLVGKDLPDAAILGCYQDLVAPHP